MHEHTPSNLICAHNIQNNVYAKIIIDVQIISLWIIMKFASEFLKYSIMPQFFLAILSKCLVGNLNLKSKNEFKKSGWRGIIYYSSIVWGVWGSLLFKYMVEKIRHRRDEMVQLFNVLILCISFMCLEHKHKKQSRW